MGPKPQRGPCCFTHSEFGRQSVTKSHTWYYMAVVPILCSARVDGLAKRELAATEMTEHFENRPDFLYLRHVTYETPTKTKKFEPAERNKEKPIVVRNWCTLIYGYCKGLHCKGRIVYVQLDI